MIKMKISLAGFIATKIKNQIKKLYYAYCLCMYKAAGIVYSFRKNDPRYKDLWLISERGIDARDNGYHLFKYIRENHPEINIVYLISDDSPDRAKVAELGPTVSYRSFAHYMALVAAKVKISTHIMGYTPEMYFFRVMDRKGFISGKKIFLQHGIIKERLSSLLYPGINLDIFVCGARKEWQYICEEYGYPEGIVRYLGLCRYDRLPLTKEKEYKRILLMPTWRIYLSNLPNFEFVRCAYYKAYNSLINSPRLKELLGQYGYKLLFYPHVEMQRFLGDFEADESCVELCDVSREDIQDLLINTDIMITDYSSVMFDYAYMGKPVIYYQFDREEYNSAHYAKASYFDFTENGFGPVVTDEDAVIDCIEDYLKNGIEPEQIYKDRAGSFFELRDNKNCERNFEAILDVLQGR